MNETLLELSVARYRRTGMATIPKDRTPRQIDRGILCSLAALSVLRAACRASVGHPVKSTRGTAKTHGPITLGHMSPYDAAALLAEVEPAVARLVERHVTAAKEWFPHDYIPYSLGRDFDKEPWTPDQPRLTGVAQTAFEVNLLTEDNLPSYHRLIAKMFSKGDGAWKYWVNRWTAEEGRHAIVIRDYLIVTRNIDPVMLERGRMQTVMTGYDHDVDVLQGLAYTSFQELATRVSHQNTGRYSEDPWQTRS